MLEYYCVYAILTLKCINIIDTYITLGTYMHQHFLSIIYLTRIYKFLLNNALF